MRLMYTRIKATANLQTRFLIRLLGKDSHSQALIIKQTTWSTPKLGKTKNQSNKPEGAGEQSNTGHDKQGETQLNH